MYLLDSSVWIALFRIEDPHHEKARRVMEQIGDAPIHLIYGVVTETTANLSYKCSKEHADRFLDFIKSNPQVVYTPPSMLYDISAFSSETKRFSLVDAALKHIALREQLILVSFDEELLKSFHQSGGSSYPLV